MTRAINRISLVIGGAFVMASTICTIYEAATHRPLGFNYMRIFGIPMTCSAFVNFLTRDKRTPTRTQESDDQKSERC